MENEEIKFDKEYNEWVYKVFFNGLTVYGRGKTQKEAKEDFAKNRDFMWEC